MLSTKSLFPKRYYRLEPSFVNHEPLDEFIRTVADWLFDIIKGRENVEVEAKLGRLIDLSTGNRLKLPVLTETILSPSQAVRFDADMTRKQHQHFNELLNRVHASTSQSDYPHSSLSHHHTRVVDSFHPAPEGGGDKIRVTRDEKTGQVLECMRKIRLGDLNIFSPQRQTDWRISVNLELPAPEPTSGVIHTRRKDRVKYCHQAFNIDLTQVTQSTAHSSSSPTHELEVEFNDPTELIRLASLRDPSAPVESEGAMYDQLIWAFVNNARLLVKNSVPDTS